MAAAWGPTSGPLVQYAPWPGKNFQVGKADEDKAAKALIGCPNGYGNAFLLLQRPVQYGGLTIDTATIFEDDWGIPCLAWTFKSL